MKQILLAFFLIIVGGIIAAAQGNLEQAAKSARDQFLDIRNRSSELERFKRTANKRTVDSDLIGNFPMIKEDFEKIQRINDKLNNEIVPPNASEHTFDYAKIAKSVAEIHRRADRLKTNLFPDASDGRESVKDKKQMTAEPGSVETLLKSLDKSINRFVHNSIFQNTKLVNPTDSQKAQTDLEILIKLSLQIKLKTLKIVKSKPGS